MFVFDLGGQFHLLPYFWLPQHTAEDRQDKVPYLQWAAEGLIKLTPGNVADYRLISAEIVELFERFRPHQFGFDPHTAEEMTQEIETESGIERVEVRQGLISLAEPSAAFERLLESGELVHNGHRLLEWQAGHVEVEERQGLIKPVKPRQGSHTTIDGIVAGVMALGLAIRREAREDYYETHALEMG